ncbi:hypothetical protein Fmac_010574 [Flemingia macrophylla]|uniref:chalcone synthase n=1 Tax=Flemingia macrophylla TaxID=520843 RepID=A0ABD1MK08_9FABA
MKSSYNHHNIQMSHHKILSKLHDSSPLIPPLRYHSLFEALLFRLYQAQDLAALVYLLAFTPMTSIRNHCKKKNISENNKSARVLVGTATVIVGADPDPTVEQPVFELVSAIQTILRDSDGAIDGHLCEVGLTFHLLKDVPGIISKSKEPDRGLWADRDRRLELAVLDRSPRLRLRPPSYCAKLPSLLHVNEN